MRGFALVDHGLLHWEGVYKLSESGAIFDKNTKKKILCYYNTYYCFQSTELRFYRTLREGLQNRIPLVLKRT